MTARRVVLAAVLLLAGVTLARAQAGPAAPAGEVPLQCWWRASAGAVHIGEVFEIALTCSALEGDTTRAVPDETRLTVAAVQLAPWEIVGGSHPADTRAGSRRLFQYLYQVRLLDPNAIGRDVRLPPLAIPYRIESRMGADAALAGRDLVHQMPATPIRIVGQVPFDASDIRDGSAASLGEIAALQFRTRAWRTAGTVLAVLAAIAALAALAPLAGRWRTTRTRAPGRASERAVLSHAAATLDTLVTTAGAAGWTPESLADAHGAARLVAGVMLGGGVRQRLLQSGEAVPEGRVLLQRRFGRVRGALTSSATPAQVTAALAALPETGAADRRARLERLRDALSTLARAQYPASPVDADVSAVDEAVRAARDLGRDEARARLWSWRHWRDGAAAPAVPQGF